MKAKWFIPVLPWISVGLTSLKHPAYWMPMEGRVLHVLGCAALSIALFAVIQPWREDGANA